MLLAVGAKTVLLAGAMLATAAFLATWLGNAFALGGWHGLSAYEAQRSAARSGALLSLLGILGAQSAGGLLLRSLAGDLGLLAFPGASRFSRVAVGLGFVAAFGVLSATILGLTVVASNVWK